MRAWISETPGGPNTLRLAETPTPEPAADEVRLAVKACGVNYFDYLIIQDLYQVKPPRPFAPGAEWSGVVDAVGDDVTRFKPGDRVMAAASYGGLAEFVISNQAACHRLPDRVSFIEGAGFQTAFGTSYYALRERGALGSGQTLLVLGAAGGLGAAAVQIGKALGARVLGLVSTTEKAAFARQQGADDVAIIGADASRTSMRTTLKTLCGEQGADVVFDPVGGDLAEAALRAIAWNGRYLVVGFTAGIPKIALNLALLKHAAILGCRWGGFSRASPDAAATLRTELAALYERGALKSIVTKVFPFSSAPAAIAALGERRGIGKFVIDFES
jgi:NADPH2:quinone reductase